MDYERIHKELVEYCKTTTPRERLFRRNKSDPRLVDPYIYTEIHHIIPKHNSGDDSSENLVKLLPEEHYLIHLLRYKWLGNRFDFLACRFMINGYMNKGQLRGFIPSRVTSKMIASFKQKVYLFRKETGWHSDEGIASISKARKGTYPVKCVNTGEIVGSFDREHPKILSGEWVHHSTGQTTGKDKDGNTIILPSGYFKENPDCKLYTCSYAGNGTGSENTNYKGISDKDKEFLISLIPLCVDENTKNVMLKNMVNVFNEHYFEPNGFKRISRAWIANHLGAPEEVVEQYNRNHKQELIYNPYYRSIAHRQEMSNFGKSRNWVTKKGKSKLISSCELQQYLDKGYTRGRNVAKN